MPYTDEERAQIMRESRDNLEKTFRVSEPTETKGWELPPREEEPEPKPRKLDLNPNADLEQTVQFLTNQLASILPALDTWMQNVNKSWSELKQRAETAEKANAETAKAIEELQKRLSEVSRSVALDIRGVELSWQSDLLSLRQAMDTAKRKEHAS